MQNFHRITLLITAAGLVGCSAIQATGAPPSASFLSSLAPKVKFKLRVAVVRGSGDVLPAARTLFKFDAFLAGKVIDDLAVKNNAGPSPDILDPKYVGTSGTVKYENDLNAWQLKAYAGKDEALKQASNGVPSVEVTTDLDGLADVELPQGKWYVSGIYSINSARSIVFWKSVEINIDSSTQKVELSNDNGQIINQ